MPKQKENSQVLEANIQASVKPSKRSHLELVKSKKENPIDYFRDFSKKEFRINGKRRIKIESVRKNSGVKVLFIEEGKEPQEEILKEDKFELLKKLISIGMKNSISQKKETDPKFANNQEDKMPEPELVADSSVREAEDSDSVQKEASIETSIADDGIDSEKRREGIRETWEEKVMDAKSISEICDIVDEIGYTMVRQEVVHPAAMKVRLQILESFTSEGLIKWKLEEITEEFGIRDRARGIKLSGLERISDSAEINNNGKNDDAIEFKKKEEPQELKQEVQETRPESKEMKPENNIINKDNPEIQKLEKEMKDAENEYFRIREEKIAKFKELQSVFKNISSLNIDNDPEIIYYKSKFEEACEKYNNAVKGRENLEMKLAA
jgi:signal recognition particle subunit SEC65